jgi:DNA-binding transcriptional MerR regulator
MQIRYVITGPTLADLAAASGLQPRTIRSWVAQGLLPAPLTRGPAARYPADTLQRLLAVRTMRDLLGMPLGAIRQELLVASAEQIAAHAAKAAVLAPEQPEAAAAPPSASPADALEYLRSLRAGASEPAARRETSASPPPPLPQTPTSRSASKAATARQGFEALEQRLSQGRATPAARKSRAEEWLRIPITPDVELAIRGRLDAEARAQLERCADLVRDILLRRDP